ncbi:hypothetical protein FOA43_003332 [Brettanomyces nanus]|uniref:Uncharacterized protein n=1 Tax=Eeniella nana TaxID=13502 RepID=A0A875S3P5_EENNA|nr:uncharacterized protein FOA43_003332 [Brettanomyces nanus]QPG75946.1 hypothetical protein FOA43_003332 [Brettanomyces nanus]
MDPLPKQNDDTDLLTAMMAGATAGAFQTAATYPFEYLKTTSQIKNQVLMLKPPVEAMNSISIRPMYTGCAVLATGNALKAATRMCLFNSFSHFMATENGSTTAPRIVVAGLMTGFVETLWVIPFENIKTRMIENRMYREGMEMNMAKAVDVRASPSSPLKTSKRARTADSSFTTRARHISDTRLKALKYYAKNPSITFPAVVKEIYSTQGLRGFKQGSLITIFRQCMNSMVWYSTFSSLQQLIDPNRDSISELELLGMGFASSCAVVATTQPLDLVKTRMQTKNYRLFYRDLMTCVFKVFVEEGLRKFWCGWFPRLIKVSCSSSVTLITYEYTVKGIQKLKTMKPFSAS